jgi:polyhydroxyalkanoate synthase
MNFESPWSQKAQPFMASFESILGQNWQQAMQTFQSASTAQGQNAASPATPLQFNAQKLQALQKNYVEQAQALWSQNLSQADVLQGDKRFAGEGWAGNALATYSAAAYLLNARTLMGLADALEADAKTQARIAFAVEQWVAATAPSNFLSLNAEAQRKAVVTQGESIAKGIANLVHDLQQGHVSMTDESQFEVGRNVATTEGAVVYENDFFQLLEYKPLTKEVFERPLLIVPPCINKFYILDLQPANSLIRYSVSQGHRTFVVSWRNPDASLAKSTWDDYIEYGVMRAISVVQAIAQAPQINALGFCVGGTMLSNALAVYAARYAQAGGATDANNANSKVKSKSKKQSAVSDQQPVASATFLTTLMDFSDTGILDVFIDEAFVRFREMEMGEGGLMKGQDLASTFSFLRPNDLVWNYVVGNYLKGETPPPFDLLYWNSDSTNLPGPFYAWYLRQFYLENNLVKPGKVKVCGESLDLSQLTLPTYLYGSREDHIVPIASAYASTQLLQGSKRFVMGASGHIAGVINPPAKGKRSHWIREDGKLPATLGQWMQGATEHPGSWWTDWSQWLQTHAGNSFAAPEQCGSDQYPVLEPAPGRYVRQRV